jgi:ABC-2 type transport system ATP-binding protein
VQTICEKILIIAKGKLIAFDEADKLENQLSPSNEISILTEADAEETREILVDVEEKFGGTVEAEETAETEDAAESEETVEVLSNINIVETEDHLTRVQLTTQHDNIYEVSRTIFFAFAKRERALLEMSLKKANLEDIFIELTREDDKS